ncbi:MAG: hypothetical protein PHI35_00045 [Victivallaceae bacterium]|nr:hypothetical protein [Victivallaceae bacterium]
MIYRRWNGDMVIDHILTRNSQEPLNSYYYATTYPSVYAAATRFYGSWREAIEAAGLDYSVVRKYREWSDQRVIDEIKALHESGEALSSQFIQTNHRPLYLAALKRFRSWSRAVMAAGFDYSSIRLRRAMTPDEIKKQIIELYRRGENLAYTNVRSRYQYLLANAARKLGEGSWDSARRNCGVCDNFRSIGQTRGKARLLNNLGGGKAARR